MKSAAVTTLPQFRRGDLLEASKLQTLSDVLAQQRNLGPSSVGAVEPIVCILDGTLPGRTGLTSQSVMATVCVWEQDSVNQRIGRWQQTERQEPVWNESAEERDPDTFGIAIWVQGAFRFFADCEPMEDRPDPPGGA